MHRREMVIVFLNHPGIGMAEVLRPPFVVLGTIVYCYGVSGGVSKMARGVVKFFNTQKGYGFIMPEGKVGTAAPDVFVHISDVVRSGLTSLTADQVVEYNLHEDRSGRSRAQNLKVIAAAR